VGILIQVSELRCLGQEKNSADPLTGDAAARNKRFIPGGGGPIRDLEAVAQAGGVNRRRRSLRPVYVSTLSPLSLPISPVLPSIQLPESPTSSETSRIPTSRDFLGSLIRATCETSMLHI
jgi:hypothetical protein